MAFYIQCLLFHQWSPWRVVMVEQDGIAVRAGFERRTCMRCGKVQERPLRGVA